MQQKFKGRLFKKCDIETGTSQSGYDWAKQTIVIAVDGSTTKVAVSLFGTECYDVEEFSEGESVEVTVNVNASEYKGKWYNNVSFVSIIRTNDVPVIESEPEELSFDDWLNMLPDS